MGLSVGHAHELLSPMSEPDRLCVGVIMKDVGPMAVSGESVYMPKELEGVRAPIEC